MENIKLINIEAHRKENTQRVTREIFGVIDQWWLTIPAIGFIRGSNVFDVGNIFSMYVENALTKEDIEKKAVFITKVITDPHDPDGEEGDLVYFYIGSVDSEAEAEALTNAFISDKTIEEIEALPYNEKSYAE